MCGGAYALKRIEQVTHPQRDVDDFKTRKSLLQDAQLADDARGHASGSTGFPHMQTKVVGLREGVWFRQWEGPIRRAVLNRLRESEPLVAGDGGDTFPAVLLDGY